MNYKYAIAWFILLGGVAVAQGVAASDLIDSSAACRIAHAPGKYIGQTITFVGEYMSDHIERTVIRPTNCDRGIGLGTMSAAAEKLIDAADRPPFEPQRRIRATFTATIVQGQRNDAQFFHDNGVRLNVTKIVSIRVIDPPAPTH